MSSGTIPIIPIKASTAIEGDGMGCHAGGETLLAAAKSAGKSEVLAQYAADYPKRENAGPHDQPQSMCPAFGSLRVGLRMRRTATILSGSACCVLTVRRQPPSLSSRGGAPVSFPALPTPVGSTRRRA